MGMEQYTYHKIVKGHYLTPGETILTQRLIQTLPVLPDLDVRILQALQRGGKLDMDLWHGCDTTHCIAGWAVVIAGPVARKLEKMFIDAGLTTFATGTVAIELYKKAGLEIPDFHADTHTALEDLKRRAHKQIEAKHHDIHSVSVHRRRPVADSDSLAVVY